MHSQHARTKSPKEEPSDQTILWQPKEGKTFFKWPTFTPPTQTTPPRVNLLASLEHVQVTWRHPQTYLRLDLMPCMLVTRIWLLPHKPRLSLNTLALLHLATTTHQTYIHFTPPTNHPTCTLQNTMQRPRHHRVHSISCLLQHPPLHRPYITPSTRTFNSLSNHEDKGQRPNKH